MSTIMARRSKKFSQEALDAVAWRIKSLIQEGEGLNAFGRRMGIDSGSISMYTNAKTMPTLEALLSIASASGVTLDWLAAGIGPIYRRDVVSVPTTITANGAHNIVAGGNVTVHHATFKQPSRKH
jgi:transcriptional regulator with XRE-family HTH domain